MLVEEQVCWHDDDPALCPECKAAREALQPKVIGTYSCIKPEELQRLRDCESNLKQAKRLLREAIRVWSYCYDCARHGRQRPCKRCDLVDEIELKFLADGGG